MKFTKFIPLVCALALACPAFADPSDSATSEQQITVDEFINITKKTGAVESADASFNDTYTTITLDNALSVTFNVITNVPTDVVYLTATAKQNSAQTKCLGGTTDALKIVFTNDSTPTGAPTGAISNCLDGPVLATNPDAIAFNLTPVITADSDSGMTVAPTANLSSNVVTYTFSKAGKCDFQYTMAQSAIPNTFDTHDTAGTYKATLSMTHTAP